MNEARRNKLKRIINELHTLQRELQELKDLEERAYDNLPSQFQYTDQAESMETVIDELDDALDDMDDVLNALDRASWG